MRSRAEALERRLVRLEAVDDRGELERQGTSRARALARELAIAAAIRREGARIDAPSFDRTWERFAVRLHHPAAARSSRPKEGAAPPSRAVAVAAAVALIVGILIGLLPRLHLATQDVVDRAVRATLSQEAQIHVRLAETRLTDLVGALHSGRVGDAPGLARALSMERSSALALGADVTGLDRRIRATIPSALARTPRDVALRIRSILGTLLASPAGGREAPGSKAPSKGRATGGSPAAPRQPGEGSPQDGPGGGSLLPTLPPLPPLPQI
jgi:hypothetical protein